ncbi:MAG: trigger factor [Nitrospirae bacterium]|nr:trigger factor [Candidatus Troglogloeales bacterium]
MKIQVKEISSVKRSLRVEVPQEAVSHEFHHASGHLQKDVRLSGFRPGKAPRSLIIKKYEEAIREEVLRKLIPEYCQKALDEVRLSPIGVPIIENIDFKKDAPLFFTALVDILPEIKLANYTGIILSKKNIPVTQEDVEKGLAVLQDQQGYLEGLPDDHGIALSDYVIIDFIGEVSGKALPGGKKKDYPVEIGSKGIRPEIEAALLGRKKGESVSVNVSIPIDDSEKEIAGKIAQYEIDIKEIKTKRLPALDEEFAKDLGLPSLPALREKVQGSLTAERKKMEEQSEKNQLMDRLIALHPFEAPSPMIERELRVLLQQMRMTVESDKAHVAELSAVAENRVKGSLILAAIAEKEKIEVSNDELAEAIVGTTRNTGVSIEKGRKEFLKNPDALRGLKEMTLAGKTLNWVYSTAQFEPLLTPP